MLDFRAVRSKLLCYGSAKQTSLFCSRLNRNVDKGGLWQVILLLYTRFGILFFFSIFAAARDILSLMIV